MRLELTGGEARIRAVAVVIPARDEQDRVAACLRSVRASLIPGLRSVVVLVADRCTDGTAAFAAKEPGVVVVEANHGCVGASRRDGVCAALDQFSNVDPCEVWIANTDADSIVPSKWLTAQVAAADSGVDLIVGTVRPDFTELPDEFVSEWLKSHQRGRPNGHVHGANLGIRASAYLRAGGFRADAEHEDTRLVDRLVRVGAMCLASDEGEVVTSGRREGRTPGGYAGYVRSQLSALAATNDEQAILQTE